MLALQSATTRPSNLILASVVSASKRPRIPVQAALFNKFKFPEFCNFDYDGNIVVSDHNNHCIQVLRYSDGAILRSFGRAGKAGDGPVSLRNPCAFAIADGFIIVADYGNHRGQVLNYATSTNASSSICHDVTFESDPCFCRVCKSKLTSRASTLGPTVLSVAREQGKKQ